MIEMVAERGYEALKVRDLVQLAGVSSRAFYEHFESKEDCFLRTYDLVARPATKRLIAAQSGEGDWRERPRSIFAAFAGELEVAPEAARLVLSEAYAAGPAALERARRTEATFEAMLAASFARAPGGIVVPPLIVEGMMAGVAKAARTRLLAGRQEELAGLGEELVGWLLCYPGKAADELAVLDLQSVWRDTRLQPPAAPAASVRTDVLAATGDRALILAAIAKLAATIPYDDLTATAIRRAAGVSRRVFDAHFGGVEDSFVAAMEENAARALTQVARAHAAGKTSPGGLYRGISALCDEIAADPLLKRICLTDDFKSGSSGARARARLVAAIAEQLSDGASLAGPPNPLVAEATSGASWAIFHHHVIGAARAHSSPQVSSTLAFIALAPVLGAARATAAIRGEQDG